MSRLCRIGVLRGSNRCLDRRHVGAVFFNVIEKMAVEIERHPNGRVAHNGLDALW
jgi:hypothetical protein